MPFYYARKLLKKMFFFDIEQLKHVPANIAIKDEDVELIENVKFLADVEAMEIDFSMAIEDRFFRCHSQAPRDFYILKHSHYKRIPDIVIWPRSHKEVVKVVKRANEHNVVIIPVGGLTNVTCANNCPEEEKRMIVSLDMTQMNRMLWLDKNSLLACFEAGIAGQDLERTLQERGFIMGHEPDSLEFSTLGGWIATRSSGIKQATYGNIENIVVSTKTVTSIGVLEKSFLAPRVSMGPELEHIVLGSEGSFGVITEVVVKIHILPQVCRYGSIMFPTLSDGIHCFRECSRNNWLPSSLRLLDSAHIQCGLALRYNSSAFEEFLDSFKRAFVRSILGFDELTYSLATYLIEGEKKIVNQQEASLLNIAQKYGGINCGEKFGKRGYLFTFTIGYSRVR